MNNAIYLNYLEYARCELLRESGFDYPGLMKAGYGIYVVRVEIDYKMPALNEDELTIKSWPDKKGAVSGVMAQEVWRGEDLLAKAKVTWAFVDSSGKPSKVPPEWEVSGLVP